MNILLSILQIILGIKLITVSLTHGFRQSLPTMQAAIQKLGKLSRPFLYFVAFCTLLGTMGLILPGLMGLSPSITPVTAAILSLMLLISIFFHVKSREKTEDSSQHGPFCICSLYCVWPLGAGAFISKSIPHHFLIFLALRFRICVLK